MTERALSAPRGRVELCTGNDLVVRGALAAGCNFFSGYPITPSSSIYAQMMQRLSACGGKAIGAPDEISALSYAVGASLTGAKAMTATSGPGWSLMIETAQYAIMTETPVVIAIVQRLGPATGGATQSAQGDPLFVRYANSGGYTIPVLAPVDARDCFALTAEAFAWAEQLRSPVILLSDKEVGTTIESLDMSTLPEIQPVSRALPPAGESVLPYGIEALEDIPFFLPVGGAHKATVTGSAHDQHGRLRKNDPETLRQLRHLDAKIRARADSLTRVRRGQQPGASRLLVSYGSSARACRQAARTLADAGVAVDLFEVLGLFPAPLEALRAAAQGMRRVVIVEENLDGLYARELMPALQGVEVRQVNGIGAALSPREIVEVTR